jgi:cytochrome c oxidase subunit 2
VNRLRKSRWALLALLLFLAACAKDAPQDSLEPEGPIARQIDNLVNPVFLVAGVVFVIVEFGMLFLVWRFRRRPDEDADEVPAQIHGNTKVELGWTIVPALILTVVSVGTLTTLFAIESEADETTMTVDVIGHQWWWEFNYDVDGDDEVDIVTANDLVVPADQKISLEITSEDVIHSFWIPKLNGKKDAVAGRVHELTVEVDEPGTYVGQCTEFCGLSHAYMRQRFVALPPTDYENWVANQLQDAETPAEGDAAAGAELFTTQCSRCHLARGINDAEFEEQGEGQGEDGLIAGPAPDLTHFATRGAFAGATFDLWLPQGDDPVVQWDDIGEELNREQLRAWLRNPPGEKPMAPAEEGQGRGMPNLELTEEQIDQLVAFLETLD